MIIIILLLLCFSINILNHGNILAGALNTLLLFLSISFYLFTSKRKISSLKSPFLLFMAVTPIFTRNNDIYTILLSIGLILSVLLYLRIKFKIMLIGLFVYIIIVSLYISRIISFPLVVHHNNLIFADDWTNLYISQVQKEALYVPYKVRLLLFNQSINIYILLSKLVDLFIFKNLYDTLLIVNLYLLLKGIWLYLKSWSRENTLIVVCVFLISSPVALSRSFDIFSFFTLLAPFLIYFVLKGFESINKLTYLILFILSIIIETSPFK